MPANQPSEDEHSYFAQWQLLTPPSSPLIRPRLSISQPDLLQSRIKKTGRTFPLWVSPSPSPGSSSLPTSSAFDGSVDTDLTGHTHQDSTPPSPKQRVPVEQIAQEKTERTIHLPADLNNHQSLQLTPPTTPRGRRNERRCVSADAATKARTHFISPDRFVTPRTSPFSPDSPFRSSKRPHILTPTERHTRGRDHNQDPFRPQNTSRSREVLRSTSASRRSNAPHFVPHFVQDHEQSVSARDTNRNVDSQRQISAGSIWTVGGSSAAYNGPLPAVDNGRGGLMGSGTTAPLHVAHFLDQETASQEIERHRNRLSLALNIDEANRVLRTPLSSPNILGHTGPHEARSSPLVWQNGSWSRQGSTREPNRVDRQPTRAVPATPFRVLDAPRLRDDFYCSTLAYSDVSRTLAVGLSSRVYLWSEKAGVQFPPLSASSPNHYVTSLSFSSTEGRKCILAVGRQGGQVSLWSTYEAEVRFEAQQPNPVSCLAFRPNVTYRASLFFPDEQAACEDLLVGDDMGNIFYYSVEWPTDAQLQLYPTWTGHMTLLARLNAHSQQICGLAWSPDKRHFATGGNDNAALLFEIVKVLVEDVRPGGLPLHQALDYESLFPVIRAPPPSPTRRSTLARFLARQPRRLSFRQSPPTIHEIRSFSASVTDAPRVLPAMPDTPTSAPWTPTESPTQTIPIWRDHVNQISGTPRIPNHILNTIQKHTFAHAAAVKALAFPIWQPTLLATGGGSNDRAIHFFHTGSGATLATISVHAQVTALIWSRTRREICATFGYAQPEHGIRIAVFAWPSGNCVVSIPWGNGEASGGSNSRALWAIPYPGGPNDGSSSSGSAGRARRRNRAERRMGMDSMSGDERLPRGSGRGGEVDSASGRRVGDGEGGTWWSRTEQEGCIIVASSDECVKFHEVWAGRCGGGGGSGTRAATSPAIGGDTMGNRVRSGMGLGVGLGSMGGVLGGSDILEGLCEGIEEGGGLVGQGDIIR